MKPLRSKLHYLGRNPDCFLVGASWASAVIGHRLIHIYLGPWLISVKVPN